MKQKYHFIGIGGIGMSALARILIDKGAVITGSDLSSNVQIQNLVQRGVKIYSNHQAEYISEGDIVVFSSGISDLNPEYKAALALKCPVLHRSDLLAQLMEGHCRLAIAGSHGKTSTSSLLTHVLLHAGFDPTFAIGGMLGENANGQLGHGKYFVAEADESDGTLLKYYPEGAIITNIDNEHLEHYGCEEEIHNVFKKFISQVNSSDLLFYCGDDQKLIHLVEGKGISYGFGEKCQARLSNFRQNEWKITYNLNFNGKAFQDIEAQLLGEHQALNSAAVFCMALVLGVEEKLIREAFINYPGVGRRCEKKGELNRILFFDDYAHHPTEIEATLKAMRAAAGEKRLVVLFQPHRFKRTQCHLKNFARAFELADQLYITDIYAAGEREIEGISAQTLISEIQKQSSVPVQYLPKQNWIDTIQQGLKPHDIFLSMGAGDVTTIHRDLQNSFPSKKIRVGLIFGGRSCEHEISLKSCRFVYESLDRSIYDVELFGIDKHGNWTFGLEAASILKSRDFVPPSQSSLYSQPVLEAIQSCDLFFPILHGTFGEDGTLQGFFEILGKPYVGPDYCSAAVMMNKVLTKKLALVEGIPTPNFTTVHIMQWQCHKKSVLEEVLKKLTFPLYVKPVHLGSSIGITKVCETENLKDAIDYAFRFDTDVMVEEGKENCREMEFAIIGNSGSRIEVPSPGEKISNGIFVDYDKKYGSAPIQTTVEPDIDPEVLKEGKELALKAYTSLGCQGMTRVDFLLDKEGTWWLFEMNPIPGMQKLSLFPKIWNREGITASRLIDRLIILALQRGRSRNRHIVPVKGI